MTVTAPAGAALPQNVAVDEMADNILALVADNKRKRLEEEPDTEKLPQKASKAKAKPKAKPKAKCAAAGKSKPAKTKDKRLFSLTTKRLYKQVRMSLLCMLMPLQFRQLQKRVVA